MRARAIREGSVGLLILAGMGLFLGLVLWLQRLTPGNRAYRLQFEFENSMGIEPGTTVRYRGVPVGRVVTLMAGSNEVQVVAEITDLGLRIPRSVQVEANQGGFIGETTIDITPLVTLAEADLARRPTGPDCRGGAILCNGDRLPGTVGVSYESLLRSADRLANLFADPAIVQSLKDALDGASDLSDRIASLTDDLSALAGDARAEVAPTAAAARSALDNAGAAGREFQLTAREFQLTAVDVRSLLAANRANVTGTLVSLNRSSDRLLTILNTLGTAVDRVDPDTLAVLTTNLETLSANAADAALDIRLAAADARALTGSLNTPENRILLQQTLESARAVFQNAQKILADLDELTGDPALRNNIRNLINGLGNLLSTTQTLEQQVALGEALTPLAVTPTPITLTLPTTPQIAPASPAPVTLSYQQLYQELHQHLEALETPAPSTP